MLMSLGTLFKSASSAASGLPSLLMSQTSGIGIGVKGLDGRYQLTNKTMETLVGKSAEQILGMTDQDLFSPESPPSLSPPTKKFRMAPRRGRSNWTSRSTVSPCVACGSSFACSALTEIYLLSVHSCVMFRRKKQ